MSQNNFRWTSCPITQNGFVRIISQPAYPAPISVNDAIGPLARATATPFHEFWSEDISLLSASDFDRLRIHGPKQITDTFLLGLAVRQK